MSLLAEEKNSNLTESDNQDGKTEMMCLALMATDGVDFGQCRAVSYTSSDGVVPQNMLDLVWLDVVIKNIDTKALYVPLPIS